MLTIKITSWTFKLLSWLISNQNNWSSLGTSIDKIKFTKVTTSSTSIEPSKLPSPKYALEKPESHAQSESPHSL